MPLYSAFTPFGHMKYAAGPSRFERIYRDMRAGQGMDDFQGGAYGPNDIHQEARIYATARCIAVSDGELERARNEARPLKTQQMLPDLEKDYGLAPAPGQTEAERRRALDLQMKIVRGSRKEALEDALETLLDSEFISATPYKSFLSPPTTWPASPTAAGNYKQNAKWRVYRLVDPTPGVLGARNVQFVDYIAGQDPLRLGEIVVVHPANPGLTEACVVTALTSAPSVDADGFATNSVTVSFAKAHDDGTVCTTAPFPLIISTHRHIIVKVTTDCAHDAVKRSAIDALMNRILRGVTTWDIVDDSGPFLIGASPLGVTPIGP